MSSDVNMSRELLSPDESEDNQDYLLLDTSNQLQVSLQNSSSPPNSMGIIMSTASLSDVVQDISVNSANILTLSNASGDKTAKLALTDSQIVETNMELPLEQLRLSEAKSSNSSESNSLQEAHFFSRKSCRIKKNELTKSVSEAMQSDSADLGENAPSIAKVSPSTIAGSNIPIRKPVDIMIHKDKINLLRQMSQVFNEEQRSSPLDASSASEDEKEDKSPREKNCKPRVDATKRQSDNSSLSMLNNSSFTKSTQSNHIKTPLGIPSERQQQSKKRDESSSEIIPRNAELISKSVDPMATDSNAQDTCKERISTIIGSNLKRSKETSGNRNLSSKKSIDLEDSTTSTENKELTSNLKAQNNVIQTKKKISKEIDKRTDPTAQHHTKDLPSNFNVARNDNFLDDNPTASETSETNNFESEDEFYSPEKKNNKANKKVYHVSSYSKRVPEKISVVSFVGSKGEHIDVINGFSFISFEDEESLLKHKYPSKIKKLKPVKKVQLEQNNKITTEPSLENSCDDPGGGDDVTEDTAEDTRPPSRSATPSTAGPVATGNTLNRSSSRVRLRKSAQNSTVTDQPSGGDVPESSAFSSSSLEEYLRSSSSRLHISYDVPACKRTEEGVSKIWTDDEEEEDEDSIVRRPVERSAPAKKIQLSSSGKTNKSLAVSSQSMSSSSTTEITDERSSNLANIERTEAASNKYEASGVNSNNDIHKAERSSNSIIASTSCQTSSSSDFAVPSTSKSGSDASVLQTKETSVTKMEVSCSTSHVSTMKKKKEASFGPLKKQNASNVYVHRGGALVPLNSVTKRDNNTQVTEKENGEIVYVYTGGRLLAMGGSLSCLDPRYSKVLSSQVVLPLDVLLRKKRTLARKNFRSVVIDKGMAAFALSALREPNTKSVVADKKRTLFSDHHNNKMGGSFRKPSSLSHRRLATLNRNIRKTETFPRPRVPSKTEYSVGRPRKSKPCLLANKASILDIISQKLSMSVEEENEEDLDDVRVQPSNNFGGEGRESKLLQKNLHRFPSLSRELQGLDKNNTKTDIKLETKSTVEVCDSCTGPCSCKASNINPEKKELQSCEVRVPWYRLPASIKVWCLSHHCYDCNCGYAPSSPSPLSPNRPSGPPVKREGVSPTQDSLRTLSEDSEDEVSTSQRPTTSKPCADSVKDVKSSTKNNDAPDACALPKPGLKTPIKVSNLSATSETKKMLGLDPTLYKSEVTGIQISRPDTRNLLRRNAESHSSFKIPMQSKMLSPDRQIVDKFSKLKNDIKSTTPDNDRNTVKGISSVANSSGKPNESRPSYGNFVRNPSSLVNSNEKRKGYFPSSWISKKMKTSLAGGESDISKSATKQAFGAGDDKFNSMVATSSTGRFKSSMSLSKCPSKLDIKQELSKKSLKNTKKAGEKNIKLPVGLPECVILELCVGQREGVSGRASGPTIHNILKHYSHDVTACARTAGYSNEGKTYRAVLNPHKQGFDYTPPITNCVSNATIKSVLSAFLKRGYIRDVQYEDGTLKYEGEELNPTYCHNRNISIMRGAPGSNSSQNDEVENIGCIRNRFAGGFNKEIQDRRQADDSTCDIVVGRDNILKASALASKRPRFIVHSKDAYSKIKKSKVPGTFSCGKTASSDQTNNDRQEEDVSEVQIVSQSRKDVSQNATLPPQPDMMTSSRKLSLPEMMQAEELRGELELDLSNTTPGVALLVAEARFRKLINMNIIGVIGLNKQSRCVIAPVESSEMLSKMRLIQSKISNRLLDVGPNMREIFFPPQQPSATLHKPRFVMIRCDRNRCWEIAGLVQKKSHDSQGDHSFSSTGVTDGIPDSPTKQIISPTSSSGNSVACTNTSTAAATTSLHSESVNTVTVSSGEGEDAAVDGNVKTTVDTNSSGNNGGSSSKPAVESKDSHNLHTANENRILETNLDTENSSSVTTTSNNYGVTTSINGNIIVVPPAPQSSSLPTQIYEAYPIDVGDNLSPNLQSPITVTSSLTPTSFTVPYINGPNPNTFYAIPSTTVPRSSSTCIISSFAESLSNSSFILSSTPYVISYDPSDAFSTPSYVPEASSVSSTLSTTASPSASSTVFSSLMSPIATTSTVSSCGSAKSSVLSTPSASFSSSDPVYKENISDTSDLTINPPTSPVSKNSKVRRLSTSNVVCPLKLPKIQRLSNSDEHSLNATSDNPSKALLVVPTVPSCNPTSAASSLTGSIVSSPSAQTVVTQSTTMPLSSITPSSGENTLKSISSSVKINPNCVNISSFDTDPAPLIIDTGSSCEDIPTKITSRQFSKDDIGFGEGSTSSASSSSSNSVITSCKNIPSTPVHLTIPKISSQTNSNASNVEAVQVSSSTPSYITPSILAPASCPPVQASQVQSQSLNLHHNVAQARQKVIVVQKPKHVIVPLSKHENDSEPLSHSLDDLADNSSEINVLKEKTQDGFGTYDFESRKASELSSLMMTSISPRKNSSAASQSRADPPSSTALRSLSATDLITETGQEQKWVVMDLSLKFKSIKVGWLKGTIQKCILVQICQTSLKSGGVVTFTVKGTGEETILYGKAKKMPASSPVILLVLALSIDALEYATNLPYADLLKTNVMAYVVKEDNGERSFYRYTSPSMLLQIDARREHMPFNAKRRVPVEVFRRSGSVPPTRHIVNIDNNAPKNKSNFRDVNDRKLETPIAKSPTADKTKAFKTDFPTKIISPMKCGNIVAGSSASPGKKRKYSSSSMSAEENLVIDVEIRDDEKDESEVSVRTALASPPPASSPSPTPPETPVPHTMSPDTVPHTMSPADTEHVSLTSQVSLHNNLQLDAEPQILVVPNGLPIQDEIGSKSRLMKSRKPPSLSSTAARKKPGSSSRSNSFLLSRKLKSNSRRGTKYLRKFPTAASLHKDVNARRRKADNQALQKKKSYISSGSHDALNASTPTIKLSDDCSAVLLADSEVTASSSQENGSDLRKAISSPPNKSPSHSSNMIHKGNSSTNVSPSSASSSSKRVLTSPRRGTNIKSVVSPQLCENSCPASKKYRAASKEVLITDIALPSYVVDPQELSLSDTGDDMRSENAAMYNNGRCNSCGLRGEYSPGKTSRNNRYGRDTTHNEMERLRRKEIGELFIDLQGVLREENNSDIPDRKKEIWPKRMTLKLAIATLEKKQALAIQLRQQTEELIKQNATKKKQLEELICHPDVKADDREAAQHLLNSLQIPTKLKELEAQQPWVPPKRSRQDSSDEEYVLDVEGSDSNSSEGTLSLSTPTSPRAVSRPSISSSSSSVTGRRQSHQAAFSHKDVAAQRRLYQKDGKRRKISGKRLKKPLLSNDFLCRDVSGASDAADDDHSNGDADDDQSEDVSDNPSDSAGHILSFATIPNELLPTSMCPAPLLSHDPSSHNS